MSFSSCFFTHITVYVSCATSKQLLFRGYFPSWFVFGQIEKQVSWTLCLEQIPTEYLNSALGKKYPLFNVEDCYYSILFWFLEHFHDMFFKQVHCREPPIASQCVGFLNGPFFGTHWTRFLCTVRSTRWIACGTSSERSRRSVEFNSLKMPRR